MREVYVAGAAMTRFGKFPDTTIRALAEEATSGALGDAGVTAADIGMVFFSNAVAGILTNQEMIRGQAALRYTGLLGRRLGLFGQRRARRPGRRPLPQLGELQLVHRRPDRGERARPVLVGQLLRPDGQRHLDGSRPDGQAGQIERR